MPELLDPPVAALPDADTTTPPLRTTEAIMVEVQSLGERIRDPNTPPAEKLAARLRILQELMPEMGGPWTPEDEALDREMMRNIDSRRPPGHRLFDQYLSEEKT